MTQPYPPYKPPFLTLPRVPKEPEKEKGRFFKTIGKGFDSLGGFDGVISRADSVISLINKAKGNRQNPQGQYQPQIRLGRSELTNQNKTSNANDTNKSGIPKSLYYIGGAFVLGGIILLLLPKGSLSKLKQSVSKQTQPELATT